MTKTRRQEWEEAVELDRMLEQERRGQSIKRLQQQTDQQYNQVLEKNNAATRQFSSGMSGVLGASSPGVSNY